MRRKGQASFEYMIMIVAILLLITVYTISVSRVVQVRQGVNETQAVYANYSGEMLAKPNCRVFFRKCGTGWSTAIAVDKDQDGSLESYAYAYDTGVVRIELLGYTKEGYPVYSAMAPQGGGWTITTDQGTFQGMMAQGGENGKQSSTGQSNELVDGIAVNTNPSNPSGEYHFYEQGGSCQTDPYPLSQPGVDETCA